MFLPTNESGFSMPSVTERTPRGEVSMDVYTRLLRDRIIWLGTSINSTVANAIMAQLLFLDNDDPREEIYMYINSDGGSPSDVLGVYDTMQFVQPDIVTICAGNSRGMTTMLLCAGTKGKRFALPNAIINQEPITHAGLRGDAPDVEIAAKFFLDMQRRIREIMVLHTGQSYERISRDFDRNMYLTPQEAIEYGIIDKIITKSPNL